MNSNKSSILFITLFFASIVLADNARFRVQILDALSAGPVKGIHVHGTFTSKFARWDNATRYSDFSAVTDEKGFFLLKEKRIVGEQDLELTRQNVIMDPHGFVCHMKRKD